MRKAGKKFTAARAAVPERPHTIEAAMRIVEGSARSMGITVEG